MSERVGERGRDRSMVQRDAEPAASSNAPPPRAFLVRLSRDAATGELIARMRVVDEGAVDVALGPQVMRVLGAALVDLSREESEDDPVGAAVVELEGP